MIYLVTPIYRMFVLLLDILDFAWGAFRDVVDTLLKTIVPQEKRSLRGANVLVTGAANGVGRCLVEEFCRHGANVVCWDVDETANMELVSQLSRQVEEAGAEVQILADKVDVTDRHQVAEAAEKVLDKFGHLDVLVNNAGIMPALRFLRQTPEQIQRTFDVNVMGNIWPLHSFLPGMYRRRSGSVVCIASSCSVMGSANLVPYCSTKHAVRGLMESLVEEERFYNSARRPLLHYLTVFPFLINTKLLERPRNRLPWLLPILTPELVARETIESLCSREEILFFPKWIYPLFLFSRLWPRRMQQRFYDLIDCGVDEQHFDVDQ